MTDPEIWKTFVGGLFGASRVGTPQHHKMRGDFLLLLPPCFQARCRHRRQCALAEC
jgi:hypothetical protein